MPKLSVPIVRNAMGAVLLLFVFTLVYCPLTLTLPLTSKVLAGVLIPIPTLPDPLTNTILEEAGESILSNAADEAPDMCSSDVGVDVPIPTLPLLEINILVEPLVSKASD